NGASSPAIIAVPEVTVRAAHQGIGPVSARVAAGGTSSRVTVVPSPLSTADPIPGPNQVYSAAARHRGGTTPNASHTRPPCRTRTSNPRIVRVSISSAGRNRSCQVSTATSTASTITQSGTRALTHAPVPRFVDESGQDRRVRGDRVVPVVDQPRDAGADLLLQLRVLDAGLVQRIGRGGGRDRAHPLICQVGQRFHRPVSLPGDH